MFRADTPLRKRKYGKSAPLYKSNLQASRLEFFDI
jgi:hypothetical protein